MAKDPKLVRPNAPIIAVDLSVKGAGIYTLPDPATPLADAVIFRQDEDAQTIPVLPRGLDPEKFRENFLASISKAFGMSYEEMVAMQYPPMAEITPKMRRLLRSRDVRKRKRGIRLYWAAPGDHSAWCVRSEIAQGNFDRSKILIREGLARMTDSAREFSSGVLKARAAVDRMTATIGGMRAGKTAFLETEMERMRAADPDAKIVVIQPRKEKP